MSHLKKKLLRANAHQTKDQSYLPQSDDQLQKRQKPQKPA